MFTRLKRELKLSIDRKKYISVYNRFRDFTMIGQYRYALSLELVNKYRGIKGDVVECGVWRGGMIAGIASILGSERAYHLFDSFEGLPEAKEIDGQAAKQWQLNPGNDYHDNCKAEREFAEKALSLAGINTPHIYEGWFKDTLSEYSGKEIAILRLDGDWYDSTMECMEALYPKVVEGGIILIDDYYQWTGCARAVHDYLSQNKSGSRVFQYRDYLISYIVKTEERT